MANIQYYISASFIGSGLGNSSYTLYEEVCGDPTRVITTVTRDQLEIGFPISVSESIEKVYLVPLLDDPSSRNCILGCNNSWSEHILSNFVASPTPTPTTTITPTPSPTSALATPTPTPTPSSSPSQYVVFGNHLISKVQIDRLLVTVPGPVWQRPGIASSIASYAANGTPVGQSTSPEGDFNTIENLDRSFDIYTEGETFIVRVSQDGDSKVWWYDDGTNSYVVFDNLSLPQSITAPTTATNLKYDQL